MALGRYFQYVQAMYAKNNVLLPRLRVSIMRVAAYYPVLSIYSLLYTDKISEQSGGFFALGILTEIVPFVRDNLWSKNHLLYLLKDLKMISSLPAHR